MKEFDFQMKDYGEERFFPSPDLANIIGFFENETDDGFLEFVDFFKKVDNKKTPSNHCRTNNVFFNGCYLMFTSKATYENWLYYTGLEYEVEDCEIYQFGNQGFFALFSDDNDRVSGILKNLNDYEK